MPTVSGCRFNDLLLLLIRSTLSTEYLLLPTLSFTFRQSPNDHLPVRFIRLAFAHLSARRAKLGSNQDPQLRIEFSSHLTFTISFSAVREYPIASMRYMGCELSKIAVPQDVEFFAQSVHGT